MLSIATYCAPLRPYALASRGVLLKSMGAELRQEACFYKEVIQDIARGCGPEAGACPSCFHFTLSFKPFVFLVP